MTKNIKSKATSLTASFCLKYNTCVLLLSRSLFPLTFLNARVIHAKNVHAFVKHSVILTFIYLYLKYVLPYHVYIYFFWSFYIRSLTNVTKTTTKKFINFFSAICFDDAGSFASSLALSNKIKFRIICSSFSTGYGNLCYERHTRARLFIYHFKCLTTRVIRASMSFCYSIRIGLFCFSSLFLF